MGEKAFHLRSFHIDVAGYKRHTGWDRFYCGDYEFVPGVNLLFGGNGQGKSSLIEFLSAYAGKTYEGDKIKKFCNVEHADESFMIYMFSNSRNNQRYSRDVDSLFELQRHWDSTRQSEGQTVMQTVSDFIYFLDGLPDDEKAVVLIDEVDSGLDAAACQHVVRKIKKILRKKPDLQVFLAFNQYEMSKLAPTWLNVCTGKQEACPKTYEEYVSRLKENKREYKRRVDRYVRE